MADAVPETSGKALTPTQQRKDELEVELLSIKVDQIREERSRRVPWYTSHGTLLLGCAGAMLAFGQFVTSCATLDTNGKVAELRRMRNEYDAALLDRQIQDSASVIGQAFSRLAELVELNAVFLKQSERQIRDINEIIADSMENGYKVPEGSERVLALQSIPLDGTNVSDRQAFLYIADVKGIVISGDLLAFLDVQMNIHRAIYGQSTKARKRLTDSMDHLEQLKSLAVINGTGSQLFSTDGSPDLDALNAVVQSFDQALADRARIMVELESIASGLYARLDEQDRIVADQLRAFVQSGPASDPLSDTD